MLERGKIALLQFFRKGDKWQMLPFFAHFFIFELKQEVFTSTQIEDAFRLLRFLPYSNIPKYLTDNSNKAKTKKKKIKFLKTKEGFNFVSTFESELKIRIKGEHLAFVPLF